MASEAGNAAERHAALKMLKGLRRGKRMTLGADKSYQEETFVSTLRGEKVAPHVAEYAPNPKWPNWLTEGERSDPGLAVSQRKRKLVEKAQAGGEGVRLDQAGPAATDQAARLEASGLAISVGGSRAQPAAHEQSDSDSSPGLSRETCLCWPRKRQEEAKYQPNNPPAGGRKPRLGQTTADKTERFSPSCLVVPKKRQSDWALAPEVQNRKWQTRQNQKPSNSRNSIQSSASC